MQETDRFLKMPDAVHMLGITRQTIMKLIKNKKIDWYRLPLSKNSNLFINVDKFLRDNVVKAEYKEDKLKEGDPKLFKEAKDLLVLSKSRLENL